MRVLILEQYKLKFGDEGAVADIPSAIELISGIQKSKFPDATFNPEKCAKEMRKDYKDKKITINEVMAVFLHWTKYSLLAGCEFVPLPVLSKTKGNK